MQNINLSLFQTNIQNLIEIYSISWWFHQVPRLCSNICFVVHQVLSLGHRYSEGQNSQSSACGSITWCGLLSLIFDIYSDTDMHLHTEYMHKHMCTQRTHIHSYTYTQIQTNTQKHIHTCHHTHQCMNTCMHMTH